MLRVVECKLYPTRQQADALAEWLCTCCWLYNQALEQRIKSYKRRKESIGLYTQTALLTQMRKRMPRLRSVPCEFAKSALRRVDRGFNGFFKRVKAGEKPGFPRFRSRHRFTSIEQLDADHYIRGCRIFVPKLGTIRFRAGAQSFSGKQRSLKIVRRATGWFAQILVDDGSLPPAPKPIVASVGIDVGLTAFATLSDGTKIDNPRWERTSHRSTRAAQRRVSRKKKGSTNRRKAVNRLARCHERVAARRKDFAHQLSRRLVNTYDLIGFENLNIKGLARTRMARSITDAAWGMFLNQLTYKAESAGRLAIAVNARGTSQECPSCGSVVSKKLSERVHDCPCGLVIDRDHASAIVIKLRALASRRGVSPVEESVSVGGFGHHQIDPMKREESTASV